MDRYCERYLLYLESCIRLAEMVNYVIELEQDYAQHSMPLKSTSCGNKGSYSFEPPVFSRPTQVEFRIPADPPLEAPLFARPNPKSKCGQPQFHSSENNTHDFVSKSK